MARSRRVRSKNSTTFLKGTCIYSFNWIMSD
uniref:Kinesin family member 15 n=1 Tax=Molossus molossus TaxID=27622 RepID=A0A7J8DBL5_MOLMO|nr:kinesin family member 15 [Molossus molossus]